MTPEDSKNLARIADALEKLILTLATRPSGGAAPAGDRQGREQVVSEHLEKWKGVKATFPAFPIHPKSCEAYEKHVATFGRVPRIEALKEFDWRFEIGKVYDRQALELKYNLTKEKAQAYMAFLKWAGLCIWNKEKSGICTLRKE